ncbi:hypothetical protein H6501_05630 [Candidatus Woesearchaeota archaeon]|nr:hypothetical protein [Nanoarchaeota archaeon]MCB9371055.1 hypothetical protein [Candidatus Woesearchaeota archaeon]USN44228.1 MAG: hypothetical protein H6500_00060 [Candidatus Woesearchaeota archaeon]
MVNIESPEGGTDRVVFSSGELSCKGVGIFKEHLFGVLFPYFRDFQGISSLDCALSRSFSGLSSEGSSNCRVGDRVSLVVSYAPNCGGFEARPQSLLEVTFPSFGDLSIDSFLRVAVTLPTPVFYGLPNVTKHDLSQFRGELTKKEGFMFGRRSYFDALYPGNSKNTAICSQNYEFTGWARCSLVDSLGSASRCFHSFENNIFRKMRSYRSSF